MQRVVTAALLICAAVVGATVAAEDHPTAGTQMADSETQLLSGQLAITLPLQTERDRSSPLNWRDESRFVYATDVGKLVIVAVETYSFIDEQPEKAIKRHLKAVGIKGAGAPRHLPVQQPLKAWEVIATPDRTALMPLLYAVFIRSADSSVQALYFYLSQEGVAKVRPWIALARKIASSATATGKERHLREGEQILAMGDIRLVITTPARWALSLAQNDEVSSRYRARKLVALGDEGTFCDIEFRARTIDEVTRPDVGDKLQWGWSTLDGKMRATADANLNYATFLAFDCRGPARQDVEVGTQMIHSMKLAGDVGPQP